jgi:catechol 2,3-dioxygenase-like lactoylglutathione lyase family enzyme
MTHRGFSHIGLSTLDLDKTRAYYEGVLGFESVGADTITIEEGGHLRHMFFDVGGGGQLIGFLEPNRVPNVPAKYDAGINSGLGVPAAFYHFAFEAGSTAALAGKRDELRDKGVETTDIVDHGLAQLIYFKDPNGLSLKYCCLVGNSPEPGALRHSEFTLPRAALELTDTLTQARSTGGRAKKGVSRHKFTAAISWLADHLIEAFAAYGETICPCFIHPGDLINGQKPDRDSERLAKGGEPQAVGKSVNRFSRLDHKDHVQDGALQSAPPPMPLEHSGSTSRSDAQTNGGIL